MTREEALNKLNSYAVSKQTKKKREQNAKMEQVCNLEMQIRELFKRMRTLYTIIKRTSELRILNGQFFTNGIEHNLGFYVEKIVVGVVLCKKNACYEPSPIFGIKGGGCCGNDLMINPFDETITYKYIYDSELYSRDHIDKLKQLLKEFDSYEQNVFAFIENLK